MSRLTDLRRLYQILRILERRVGGARTLATSHGRMDWPTRGVYFFLECGETRTDTGEGPRVVRVGTHALKAGASTKLWTRLATHRGPARSRGGNHRGSIFRLIVGTAIIERDAIDCPSWDDFPSSAPRHIRDDERDLETAVSLTIGEMPVLWLPVLDEPGPASLRGYIERNAISLLANYARPPLDPPSDSWLGHHCSRAKVRLSGLWNSDHVDETYDPSFLDTMARLVDQVGIEA